MLDRVSTDQPATAELEQFAAEYHDDQLAVRGALAAHDIRQDGEAVTRMLLVLSDPDGDTWDIARVRELRVALGRKVTELGLPPVSLTLVAESEPEAADAFVR